MRFPLLAALVIGAAFLAGCSRGFRVITPEVDNKQALHDASAFHVKPVRYDFEPPPDWEVSGQGWETRTQDWSDAFEHEVAYAGTRPVYSLGADEQAKSGAVIEFVVTEMDRGLYTYVINRNANIRGFVIVTDAATGDVLLRGSVNSWGQLTGHYRYSYEGRIETAHWPVGEDLAWMIDRDIE